MTLFFRTVDQAGNYNPKDRASAVYISADGFGSDGVCEHTGKKGQNSDFVKYEYDTRTSVLKVDATTRAEDGSYNRGQWNSQPMTAAEAIRLAHFMDSSLTQAVQHQTGGAASLNALQGHDGKRLDGEKLNRMLELAVASAGAVMDGQSPGERFFNLVSPHVEKTSVGYKDVRNDPDRGHLEGTTLLRAGDRAGYFEKDRLGLWVDGKDGAEGRWIQPEKDDAKSIRQFMNSALKALGLEKTLGAAVAADFGANDTRETFKDRLLEDPQRTANILLGSSAPSIKQVAVAPPKFGR